MRSGSFLLLAASAALSGCASGWDFYNVPTDCEREFFFADGDGDLWGDPAIEPQLECDPPTGFEATNGRDCDDGDALVTGRIGSICPDQLVYDPDDGGTFYTGVITGQSEYVVVEHPTITVWPGAAEDACGPYGWGGITPRPTETSTGGTEGHLATFSNAAQLTNVLGTVSGSYAAFVGFRPENSGAGGWEAGWGYYDSTNTWIVEAASFSLPFCNCLPANANQATCADVYDDTNLRYLALVDGFEESSDRCLGTPDEVLTGTGDEPDYARLYGHFVCERPIPDQQDYDFYSEEEGLPPAE